MGIQSTQIISRKHAIDRIIKVSELIYAKEYKNLEDIAYEPYEDIEFFVKSHLSFDYSDIEKWTDGMIEKVLDKPFFRKGVFDNYIIGVLE